MRTNTYYSIEDHRKLCYKLNKGSPPHALACEGCLLVKEIPIHHLPGYTKKICDVDKLLERRDFNAD